MSKKMFITLTVILALVIAGSGVSAADVIKIGLVTALSPPGSVESGKSLLAGAEIAVREINDTGGVLGKKVKLVVGDTAGLPEKGNAVMERLITHDKVVAVGGELHSSVGMAEIEVAHRTGIPIVLSETWADGLTAKQYPEVFRLTVSNSLIYTKAAIWMKDAGFKHVAVIGENSDWGLGVIQVFKDNLDKAGIKVTTFSAERSVTDFTPQLLQLKRMKPPVDFLVDGFTGAGELLMIKQAYELGFAPTAKTALLGAGMDVMLPEFWETCGEAGRYVLANPAGLPGLPKTAISDRFNKTFKAEQGRLPDVLALEGYDTVMVIAEAIKASQSTESSKIIAALEDLVWEGTRGVINFTTQKTPDWAYHMWMDVPVFIIQFTEVNQDPSKAPILWPDKYATVEGYIKPEK